ncbi:MAG: cytochrome P450 [Ectothiorhodospiraceae bacterium]|nr:cytochrome P450 [Chromatiales bacterium]MCP5156746.1 cytochrome P450 [Ectothiorhodospiraceae bacterium]
MPVALPAALDELARTATLLWHGRDNLVRIWPDEAFEWSMFSHRFVFRDVFVVNNPQGVRHVLATNVENYRKSVYTERVLKPLVGDGLFISHGELWRRQRRIATPAFHRSRVREFARVMVDTAREMVERWATLEPGTEIEVTREMAEVTMEVVARTMFSGDLGPARTTEVFEAFGHYQETLGRLDILEMIGLPRWLPRLDAHRARDAVRRLDAVLDDILRKREADHLPREDLLELLMRAEDPETGQRMSRRLLRDEAAVIILAGHETTANALGWALYLLGTAPEIEARLHAEVDGVLGGRDPTFDDLPAVPYARAVIDETLRLYPPVHVFSREAQADDQIGKRRVRAGSMVVIAPWLLHRHRKHWREPDVFRPERFLPPEADERPKLCYLPFGAGPRTCIGSGFGLAEATLILVMMAQRFRLRLREGHPVEPLGRLTLRPHRGLPMRLEPRGR